MGRESFKPIYCGAYVSASIHNNVSEGYFQTGSNGVKVFVPYDKQEVGQIHSFLNPERSAYNRMKWYKTKNWKDQEKAKRARFKKVRIYTGLNTTTK